MSEYLPCKRDRACIVRDIRERKFLGWAKARKRNSLDGEWWYRVTYLDGAEEREADFPADRVQLTHKYKRTVEYVQPRLFA
jgi:hypothetical protein